MLSLAKGDFRLFISANAMNATMPFLIIGMSGFQLIVTVSPITLECLKTDVTYIHDKHTLPFLTS